MFGSMKVNRVKRILSLSFLFFWFGIIVLNTKVTAEIIEMIIAIVNDDIITLSELNDAVDLSLKNAEGNLNSINKDMTQQEIKREILDRLIQDKLIDQEVKKRLIVVSESEVDNAIDNIMRENHLTKEELIEKLKSDGIVFDMYKEQIKQEMERMKIVDYQIKSKIVLNDDELREYYTRNMHNFKVMKEVRVQHILLSIPRGADEAKFNEVNRKAKTLLLEIKNGEDFGKLAEIYSQGASADSGGDMGWFKRGELIPFLEKVVFNLKIGEVSNIIRSDLGLHIIKVMDGKVEGFKTFEEAIEQVKSAIYQKRVEDSFKEWIKDLKDKSFIKINL
ncbi:MAG: peptidylprolyl isomerase [Thermodesulfobacteriota bacterium]|nr:peptidylprolyl isomerase [Thermodesulfobacteriota bacterium]